mmetsp:Transcript_2496/g.4533  ORF Transcript_2496/g.4533 Transcript_2496/m.4533 type:complete len:284 (-) Transcript_2496:352-1203(-)|eukprot:CAMPEP_0114450682 /NCGR_PEP_ID=MMETSP0104-20121206/588_1 /TAXON_ID=37642 ORGANISM="Paraphysomonas imperforata, Strain PA2" /NCGR_SAMPLE_ID=MMETSP0104 /ASSEMBLY_ACC=CAM_ASM_000202 /LENGTH=283 /DNA_ID=CAMNT_0001622835 /DNA_START=22 /DNA_END=873 /DNA_ORIENTATION=+
MSVDNFTNDSAMMIAWERALETKREDALFQDPLAERLAGTKGQTLSDNFGGMCTAFGLEGWPEFHKTWVAVRTRFIDDCIADSASMGTFSQLVNVGSGMDTRPYRQECFSAFSGGAFQVDMEAIQTGKAKIFSDILGAPSPYSPVVDVTLDLLDTSTSLKDELCKTNFNAEKPAVFVSEGLVMYLGKEGKLKLLRDVSTAAAPGSVFVLQFMDASESQRAKSTPEAMEAALSVEEIMQTLPGLGWDQLQFSRFGDEKLSFGRFPTDKFEPQESFSFCVCTKVR